METWSKALRHPLGPDGWPRPAAGPPSWHPREHTGEGPGQGKDAAEGGTGGWREPGLVWQQAFPPVSLAPPLPFPGLFHPARLTLTHLSLPCPPPFLAPAKGGVFMDKVSYWNNMGALLQPVQASFLESPQVLPNKWWQEPRCGQVPVVHRGTSSPFLWSLYVNNKWTRK